MVRRADPGTIRRDAQDANILRENLQAVQQTAAVILGGIAPEPRALAAAA
jgi:hypothetical protein